MSCNNRSFTSTPVTSLHLPFPFATASLQSTDTGFAVAWAASFFFWRAEALLLATLHILSLPENPSQQTNAFWRKKRTAAQQIPHQVPNKHHHKNSVTTEEGETSTSVTTSTTSPSKSQDHSQTNHPDPPTSRSKKHQSSPNLPLD